MRVSGRAHYARFGDASSKDACLSKIESILVKPWCCDLGCVGLSGENAGRAWSYAILLEKEERRRNETLTTKNSVYERSRDKS